MTMSDRTAVILGLVITGIVLAIVLVLLVTVREWPIVVMTPTRHYAYAVQWFAMAFVLLVIYLMLSFKKSE